MAGLKKKASIMDESAIQRSLTRIAHEILEHNQGDENFALVGIVRRGAMLADLLQRELEKISGHSVQTGYLDISFYRDDVERSIAPVLHATHIPFSIDKRSIVLVDDVLYTGRTVRSAMDALIDYGRPSAIQLAVLVDRGHRELPIRADYVGKNVPSSRHEDVRVRLKASDGACGVEIWGPEKEITC